MYIKLVSIFLLSWLMSPIQAEPQVFTSGPQRVGVMELYTSQGCSSCPPAEKYLNNLRQSPGLWKKFIPMAFHVDYWNYLGWRDRFSDASYSQRQRQYARVRNMATIYTPGFFVDGQEWRRRFSRGMPTFHEHKVGNLNISIEQQKLRGEFIALAGAKQDLQINVVLLGMNLKTQIKRGEREGSNTRHEFVVLSHQQQPLKGNRFTLLLDTPKVKAKEYALAAWVSQGNDPTPLQAVGGMLK